MSGCELAIATPDIVDESSLESFPASDPPSWSAVSRLGRPVRLEQAGGTGRTPAEPSPAISGTIHAFYLFDVAHAIDLTRIRRRRHDGAGPEGLRDKGPGTGFGYEQPPVVLDGTDLGCAHVNGLAARVTFYDYGVLSLRLEQPFAGTWPELIAHGQHLMEDATLTAGAAATCQHVLDILGEALTGRRSSMLTEDYLTFVVTDAGGLSAGRLVAEHGVAIAQLLRGEPERLSRQEQDEVLRSRVSYLDRDLFVPAWHAAFVYDTEEGADATLEILELANSHLLEFRYYDELLETELERIYAALQTPRWTDRLSGRRHTRAARRLHALFIDVNELTDRLGNAVKFVGDLYSARVFTLAASRLGLDAWKRNVQDKLDTLGNIYRFTVEQTSLSRGNMLELIIVLILVLELGLLLTGVME